MNEQQIGKRTNDLIALEIGYAKINHASLAAQLEVMTETLELERKARLEAEAKLPPQPATAAPAPESTQTAEPALEPASTPELPAKPAS
jgi:hypothetical protein